MKHVANIIMTFFLCLIPISIMGMAAWLIYESKDGWGWFLFCAVTIAGSFKFRLKDDGND